MFGQLRALTHPERHPANPRNRRRPSWPVGRAAEVLACLRASHLASCKSRYATLLTALCSTISRWWLTLESNSTSLQPRTGRERRTARGRRLRASRLPARAGASVARARMPPKHGRSRIPEQPKFYRSPEPVPTNSSVAAQNPVSVTVWAASPGRRRRSPRALPDSPCSR